MEQWHIGVQMPVADLVGNCEARSGRSSAGSLVNIFAQPDEFSVRTGEALSISHLFNGAYLKTDCPAMIEHFLQQINDWEKWFILKADQRPKLDCGVSDARPWKWGT